MCFCVGLGYSEPLEDTKIVFSVPAGDAVDTLSLASEQASIDLVFRLDIVSGVKTQSLSGSFTVEEAFEYLLLGTDLMLISDMKSHTYAIIRVQDDSELKSQNLEMVNPKHESTTKMNRKQNIAQRLFAGITSLLIATSANLSAQDINDDDNIFELSPFVIESSEDIGYLASSTLAGTRLRTNLSDVGASISVVTLEFLEDTGSTDLRDILVYTAGTEVTGLGGNFSGSGFNNEQFLDTSLGNSPGTRVRGLAGADLTRNFFRSLIPFESYNSDRLEINRGSNAILFGVGSPAGIINYSNNLASLDKDFGSTELRFGRFDSERLTIDINRTALDGQLGIRASLLHDHEKFQQKPAENKEQRAYVAATWKPDFLNKDGSIFSSFTVRANYESGQIRANNPRSLPPQDYVTQWFTLHPRQAAVGMSPKQTWDPTVNWNNPGAGSQLFVFQNTSRSPIVYFQDHNSEIPQSSYSVAGVVPNAVGNQNVVNGLVPVGNRFRNGVGVGPWRFGNRLRTSGDPLGNFIIQPVFTDESIFDFRNKLLDGPNKHEDFDFDAVNLVIEQLFLDNTAGIEVAFDSQNSESFNQTLLRGTSPWISIDVNVNLLDGTPNPNFGRPLTATAGQKNYSENELDTLRVTAFYELNLEDKFDGILSSLLGKHTFTLLWQSEELSQFSSGGFNHVVTNDYIYGNNNTRSNNNGKIVVPLSYLGPSISDRQVAAGANIPGINAYRLDFPDLIQGKSFYLRRQGVGHSFEEVTNLNIIRDDRRGSEASTFATKNQRDIESLGFSVQSRFFNNHIIGTFGVREETVDTFSIAAPVNPGENNRLINDPSFVIPNEADLSVTDTVTAWSVVAKTPLSWLEDIPFISGLNFHYNESENFAPPTSTRFNALGDLLSPPSGDTKDYGFTVSLLDNRVIVKVVNYDTKQANVTEPTITNAFNSVIQSYHNLAFNSILNGFNTDSDGDGFPDNYVMPPQFLLDLYNVEVNDTSLSITNPGVVATTDFVSEGTEIEVHFNLTDSWTLTFNAAKQESVRSNSGALVSQVLYETPVQNGRSLFDLWNDASLGGQVLLFSGGETLANYSNRLTTIPIQNVTLQDGGAAQELREWRWNAVTNYNFNEGKLSGFGIGAAARWQDQVAIGFPIIETGNGDQIQDVANPYLGPSEFNMDAWINYSRKIMDGKVDWKIQLNIRNVLGEDDLIPVRAQPWGEHAVFRIPESTVWTLSSKFSF